MIRLENVSLAFPEWRIEKISFEVKKGSFASVVGPSGCGKTTLLRIIAGLLQEDKGNVFFEGKNVSGLPPEKRNVGFVFQNNSLFTHLNVFENIAFGLRMRKEEYVTEKVLKTLELVNLKGFETRAVGGLSGGEQKRVALGRAISFNPALLLLDEPLNGMDASLKEKMKVFLKELQEKTGITTVMVTHDIDEAFFLSDKIIVLNNGQKMQEDSPENIFLKPKNSFVKKFVSDYELIEAQKKTINGKNFIQGKFLFPAKKDGKRFFLSFKKTNYKAV